MSDCAAWMHNMINLPSKTKIWSVKQKQTKLNFMIILQEVMVFMTYSSKAFTCYDWISPSRGNLGLVHPFFVFLINHIHWVYETLGTPVCSITSDQVNPGESYDPLLMSLVKSNSILGRCFWWLVYSLSNSMILVLLSYPIRTKNISLFCSIVCKHCNCKQPPNILKAWLKL